MEKYDSPQEEALEIALKTRRKILDSNQDYHSILRSCFVVALNMSRRDDLKWIKEELSGNFTDLPEYRTIKLKPKLRDKWEKKNVKLHISTLQLYLKKNESINYDHNGDGEIWIVQTSMSLRILNDFADKCFFFLNECISELQYSGKIQSIFEGIRKNVDSKLMELDVNISDEIQSIYLNLTSTNPSDKIKVAHSCRRILKFLADKIFPARDEKYKAKDGRDWNIKDNNFLNRLICYFDCIENELEKSEIEFVEKYFRKINLDVQNGEHKRDITSEEASTMAIHTYLIVNEILNTLIKNN